MPTTDFETAGRAHPHGGCYRIQVLVVGRQKAWREAVSAQIRRMGFQATACDRGTDAMTVLALGLPVDVLVIDASLTGSLCCAGLAVEARALRPGLRIVLSGDAADQGIPADAITALVPDAPTVRRARLETGSAGRLVASTVRDALGARAA